MVGAHQIATTEISEESLQEQPQEGNWICVKGTEEDPGKLLERTARHD